MCWNQRVMEGDTVLCDVAYKYRDNNIKRLSNYNYVACNIRGVDGGPLENSRKFLPRGNKRDGEVQVKAEEKKPAKKVAPLQRTTIGKMIVHISGLYILQFHPAKGGGIKKICDGGMEKLREIKFICHFSPLLGEKS